MNIHYYPFDKQECPIVIESWVHNTNTLDVRIRNEDSGVDIESYSKSTEWELKGITAQRHETYYNCCGTSFANVVFKINIQRSSQYFMTNIILPCSFIALLSLMSFVLPPDCGERVSFLITILLAMTVYMTVITDKLPQAPGYPVISVFFLSMIIHISCTLIANCVVISFHCRKYPMPNFVYRFVNEWLARLVMLRGEEKTEASYNSKDLKSLDAVTCDENGGGIDNKVMENETTKITAITGNKERAETRCKEAFESSMASEVDKKWIFAARVLDRTFVSLFLIAAFVILMVTFFRVAE